MRMPQDRPRCSGCRSRRRRPSIGSIERAIALQPDYALAYSALVMTFSSMRNYAMEDAGVRERAAASRALELDPVLAEAHAAMGASAFDDWDLNAALTHFSKARELNPNSIDTCGCFTVLLSALGRHPEAISLIEHTLTHRRYTFDVYTCQTTDGKLLKSDRPLLWVTLSDLDRYPLPRPHLKIVQLLQNHPTKAHKR